MSRKIVPNSAKNTRLTATLAPLKARTLKSRTSSIGDLLRSSQAAKPPSSAALSTKSPRMRPSVQPRDGASIKP